MVDEVLLLQSKKCFLIQLIRYAWHICTEKQYEAITRKIRMRYANADAIFSGLDPSQMNESQIIFELRTMGFEIIALAGGPYSVKDTSGGRVTKPFALVELQEFLKEKRSQFGDCPASAPMRDRNNQEDFDHLLEGLRKEGLPE